MSLSTVHTGPPVSFVQRAAASNSVPALDCHPQQVVRHASGIGFHGVALDTPMEEMARVTPTLMNVNLLGPMLLTRGCLPMMLSEHPDRCANVCSQGCGHNIL